MSLGAIDWLLEVDVPRFFPGATSVSHDARSGELLSPPFTSKHHSHTLHLFGFHIVFSCQLLYSLAIFLRHVLNLDIYIFD